MMNNWGGMGSGGWIIALLVLVVGVAVIVAVVYLVRGLGAGGAGAGSAPPQTSPRESPQDVLKINRVQGYDFEGYERTIDVHVKNLRKTIEPNSAHPRYVETVIGSGYRLVKK